MSPSLDSVAVVNRRVWSSEDWLDNHPGGSEVVLLMAGRDATDAFASYHPFTDKPRKVRQTLAVIMV